MIEIQYKEFRVGPFMPVFGKIASFEKFPPKTLYNTMRLMKVLNKEQETWNELFKKVVMKHANKDEKGELIPRKNKEGKDIPGSFEVAPANEEAWKKDVEELDGIVCKIDRHKLNVETLMGAGLEISPQEALILEPLLTDEVEPEAKLKSV